MRTGARFYGIGAEANAHPRMTQVTALALHLSRWMKRHRRQCLQTTLIQIVWVVDFLSISVSLSPTLRLSLSHEQFSLFLLSVCSMAASL